jgi:ribonuclease-3 family protein
MQNYFQIQIEKSELKTMSALALAHMGDCVFELLVRSWLCAHGKATSANLHKATVSHVSAPAQAKQMDRMLPLLTEEEAAIYRRGRNAHVHGVPKAATPGEYARATGLECLFGALFLTGQTERVNELFVSTMEDRDAV